ncbi:TlpA disulfide reductase family protein [Pontibacter harenae]|uniref:TlpA disulfide reductase family protein n=1 Tax=Pontibacter harenae TaxID=2894083 RepID=UPI001E2F3B0A|nr:TlpA disulfide reductase family protein [Pontibacter harenae]MCC9167885.1 AhpC/TSA family protein [Pontibacter harenae]
MKNLWLTPLCALLMTVGCSEKQISTSSKPFDGFRLTGTVRGVPDSTFIFVDKADNISGEITPLDSAMVIDGRFELAGAMEEPAMKALIRNRDFSDLRFIWLEKKQILFNAEKGRFSRATISGSETELKSIEMHAAIVPLHGRMDSLRSVLKKNSLAETERALVEDKLKGLEEEIKQWNVSFIKQNPSSMLSASILNISSTKWGRKTTEELFAGLSGEIRNSRYGVAISNYLLLNKSPHIGDQFADFSQQSLDGRLVRLSDYKGKVVLVEFWAAWCGPCRLENPNLVRTYNSYKAKGFEVVGVSLDSNKSAWAKAVEKDGLPWVHVSELNGLENSAAVVYGVSAIPDNFLINSNGTVVGRNLRGEKLNEMLAELLK